jgi:lysozyme
MHASDNCISLIKKWEGLSLTAVLCPAGIPTLGYGTTRYEDGSRVKLGEKVTIDRAEDLLRFHLNKLAARLPNLPFNQNQVDAVLSFCYNVGFANFINSTMCRLMKMNVNDPKIKDEFRKWVKANVNGQMKVLNGLVRRREAEIALYEKS